MEAIPGQPGLMYISFVASGEVFCSYHAVIEEGEEAAKSAVLIQAEEGGKKRVLLRS